MPSEERFVTFSLSEVSKALSIYFIQKDMPSLPSGDVVSFALSEDTDDADKVFVKVEDETGSVSDFDFERKFFAEALVFYCQGSGIPLPKSGSKFLNITNDKIVMKITLSN
ncbi:MAG: hypothetical protein AB8B83_00015 [Bdellovibrionales bacterium]